MRNIPHFNRSHLIRRSFETQSPAKHIATFEQLEGRRLLSGNGADEPVSERDEAQAFSAVDAYRNATVGSMCGPIAMPIPGGFCLTSESGGTKSTFDKQPASNASNESPTLAKKPSTPESPAQGSPFQVFSALIEDDSTLINAGADRVLVSYTGMFDRPAGSSPEEWTINEEKVRNYARRASAAGQPLVVDIEHWSVDIRSTDAAEVDAAIDRFLQIISWVKDERPDVEIGFYGLLPIREYWTPVQFQVAEEWRSNDPTLTGRQDWYAERADQMTQWHAANDRLQELADAVDFIAPSLYTFYDDVEAWSWYAEANLAEAASYGKPVYAFVWPKFHQGGWNAGEMISPEFWQHQLDFIRQHADGVIIWGSPDMASAKTPWLATTLDFIDRLSSEVDTRHPSRQLHTPTRRHRAPDTRDTRDTRSARGAGCERGAAVQCGPSEYDPRLHLE